MRIPWKRRSGAVTGTSDETAPDAAVTPIAEVSAEQTAKDTEPSSTGATIPAEPVAKRKRGRSHAPGRRGLIPRWAPWAAGGFAAVVLITLIVVLIATHTTSVRVPVLTGLTRTAAVTRAKKAGFVLVVRDTKFSASVPAGSVVTQSPASGRSAASGSVVLVDLSAGSETFVLPDVIGKTLDAARTLLRNRGLNVEYQTAASSAQQGTVIASVPSADATVTTGSTVMLTIAAGVGTTDTVLPSDLTGLGFVLDPAPEPTGATSDISYDVARRVRALLEAAGARVVMTRTVTDTAKTATSATRLEQAKESTSSALVGIFVASSGTSGLQVQSVANTGTASATFSESKTLAKALLTAVRESFTSVSTTAAVGDTVMEGVGVPAAKIRLGSNTSSTDTTSFADSDWADNVARDIYRALARVYGGQS
jgi:N-acetylmuramoyl-L-alanine amidase